MATSVKSRLLSVSIVLLVIPIGLWARSHRADADPGTLIGFLATYTGDTLWPIMFYFAGRFSFPNARIVSLLAFVLTLTLTLEFSQLWKPPFLEYLRQKPGIGFVLGSCFIWSDVVCCFVGSAMATFIDVAVRRLISPMHSRQR